MKQLKILLLSLIICLGVWTLLSWPVPRYCFTGIPMGVNLKEGAVVQSTVPGDHVQLLYYFWLAGDMLAGKTPPLHNPYEFNTGNDEDNFDPYPYYFPFSAIYAAGSAIGGRAFGWNLTGFLSLWMTYLLTWLLLRRYTKTHLLAGATALICIVLPFRWFNLFGGSPAGFAMVWIPAIALGIDLAVRENRVSGGVLAGAAVFLASWTDLHIFFFGTLLIPCWCVIAFINKRQFNWAKGRDYLLLIKALLPVAVFLAAALAFPALTKWVAFLVTGIRPAKVVPVARTIQDVINNAPDWRGIFSWREMGSSNQIYIGYSVTAFIIVGWLAYAWKSIRDLRHNWRSLLIMTLLILGLSAAIILALGPRGPMNGVLFRACLRIIPPYCMIRQSAKIFCLIPTLLGVASALSLAALVGRKGGHRRQISLALLFGVLVVGEQNFRLHPVITMLEPEQQAYAAVAQDSDDPHALILPLWPGDSHQSSLYQYFVSLYHIRMINGYNPFIKKDYFDTVFRKYESANQGWLSDDQITSLREMNINYILLHEDVFPEKVSPFPATFTLNRLFNHPRLQFLKQDQRVWAFKLLPEATTEPRAGLGYDIYGSARHWEAEAGPHGKTQVRKDPQASGGAFLSFSEDGDWFCVKSIPLSPTPNLNWLVRAKGTGTFTASIFIEDQLASQVSISIESDAWTWISIPITDLSDYAPVALKLEREEAQLDFDLVLLIAGEWQPIPVGDWLAMPAPSMFHAGYTSLEHDAVVLLKNHDRKTVVFYGPKLPLEKGKYKVELIYDSLDKTSALLGQFNIRSRPGDRLKWIPVVAGNVARYEFIQNENLPVSLEFLFLANADMEIREMIFTRIE